jgi:hypothetical protein
MHNGCYREFPENTPKQKMVDYVLEIVARSGDGYGTDRIKFFDDPICDNSEAAQKFIEERDRDFYGGYAVRYYDFSKVKDNKKVEELRKKINETIAKENEFVAAHSVKNQKAVLIGCAGCGSKLSREHLRGNRCPLCHSDLRSASTLERIESYEKRIAGYQSQIDQEKLKDKKKANIMWLVKFEYHS